jgi:predicted RNA-binding protein YlqC (UPF0109 family)
MKDAKARSLMDDVVVNSVSPHALCRCIERRLPLDALAGHARGVTTVFSRSGRTITVYPRSSRCSLVPGHFELGERPAFPAALVRDAYAFGVPNEDAEVAIDATGAIQHVLGKRGRTIKRICAAHGVHATVYGATVLISGPGSTSAVAEIERIIVNRPLRIDVGRSVGRVIGKGGRNVKRIEREFGTVVTLSGTVAQIRADRSGTSDVQGACAAIEALLH